MENALHERVLGAVALDTAAITTNTTTVGNIIDTAGFESIEYFIQAGTLTDGDYVVKLEDGDDSGLSDAADVPAANLLGALPAIALADDDTVVRVGTNSKKRYQRLSLVSTNVTTGGTLGATAVLGHPHHMPTDEQV